MPSSSSRAPTRCSTAPRSSRRSTTRGSARSRWATARSPRTSRASKRADPSQMGRELLFRRLRDLDAVLVHLDGGDLLHEINHLIGRVWRLYHRLILEEPLAEVG